MTPPDLQRITGPNLTLRLVQSGDAAYIHALRSDKRYNLHLSPTSNNVDDQRQWIEAYKLREDVGSEYYYMIERKDGLRCGLVRLYDIGAENFTWGSWILDENKPSKAALESAVLSFGIGFDLLKKSTALVDVRVANERAVSFYRRFGMTEIAIDDQNIYFTFHCEQLQADRQAHLAAISTIQTDAGV